MKALTGTLFILFSLFYVISGIIGAHPDLFGENPFYPLGLILILGFAFVADWNPVKRVEVIEKTE